MMCGFEALADRISIRNYLPSAQSSRRQAGFPSPQRSDQRPRHVSLHGPGWGDGTREWVVVHPYVLLYEVDEPAQIVRLLSVWHMSQDRP
ncbi:MULTISPECIES: type II toxin-antitoxin system RelE/ParE family toxin [Acetobacteraceae]|uniref:type II toxin-antitoxin system RelE/ParE family toxin n=1 Tax=Acetobacteraceae TaxID=433 RepID=UPI00094F87DB